MSESVASSGAKWFGLLIGSLQILLLILIPLIMSNEVLLFAMYIDAGNIAGIISIFNMISYPGLIGLIIGLFIVGLLGFIASGFAILRKLDFAWIINTMAILLVLLIYVIARPILQTNLGIEINDFALFLGFWILILDTFVFFALWLIAYLKSKYM